MQYEVLVQLLFHFAVAFCWDDNSWQITIYNNKKHLRDKIHLPLETGRTTIKRRRSIHWNISIYFPFQMTEKINRL